MSAEVVDFMSPSPAPPSPHGEFRKVHPADETEQDKALRRMADTVHRLNLAVIRCVEAGLTIELVRTSRYHDGAGSWGDQMVPMVRETPKPDS